ncbi:MAG: hypothetical protein ACN6PO_05435 [Stenotrophomonas bentonitica]|jgi:hypothetical protein
MLKLDTDLGEDGLELLRFWVLSNRSDELFNGWMIHEALPLQAPG